MGDRNEQLMEDLVETLVKSADQGWDDETFHENLSATGQSHGFWYDQGAFSMNVGVDIGVADASIGYVPEDPQIKIKGSIDLPHGRPTDLPDPTPGGVGAELTRGPFLEISLGGDNVIRAGMETSVSANIGRVGAGGAANIATDGTAEVTLSGEVIPTLIRGRVPLSVGGEVSFSFIDEDQLIEDRLELFEPGMEALGGGEAAQQWARGIVSNVLDDESANGNRQIPEERLIYSSAVANLEETGDGRFAYNRGDAGALGEARFAGEVSAIEGKAGYYRLDGGFIFGRNDNVVGYRHQKFDAIIDSSGDVVDGYMVEARSGNTTFNQDYSLNGNWNGDVGGSVPAYTRGYSMTDIERQIERNHAVADQREQLDELEQNLPPLPADRLYGALPDTSYLETADTPTRETDLESAITVVTQGEAAARDHIRESASDGTLTLEEANIGKMLSQTGTPEMMQQLRDADVETIHVAEHDADAPYASVRANLESMAATHQQAGLPTPDSEYIPWADPTGVSNTAYNTARSIGGDAGESYLRNQIEDTPENVTPTPSQLIMPEEDYSYDME